MANKPPAHAIESPSPSFALTDVKVERKHLARLELRERDAAAKGRSLHPLHRITLPHRIAKLSAQFVRTIRNHVFRPETGLALLSAFAVTLASYA